MKFIKTLKMFMDGLIYLFVGPFMLVGSIPYLLMDFDREWRLPHFISDEATVVGYVLMNLGAALAIWCTALMLLAKGSPLPNSPAKKLICSGPYAIIRHPMMYSLLLVGIGELFVTGSLLMLAWIFIAARASMRFADLYEEPALLVRFGDAYKAYCANVPRWVPNRIAR